MTTTFLSNDMQMVRYSIAVSIAFTFLTIDFASAAIVGFTAATNDRFTNSPSYILNSFDVSGVGKEPDVTGLPGEHSAWATAISRNVVISAFHAKPSGEVHFYANNDPSSTPVIRNVVSGERIGSSDLWMGTLDSALPETISYFEIADEYLTGIDGETVASGSFQDMNAYLFSQIVRADNPERDQRTGRNKVSGYVENIDFLGLTDNDSILFEFDTVDHEDFVEYETQFITHDSGGPTFVDVDGELVLLGLNSFLYTTVEGGGGSGITYVGTKADTIRDYIAANSIIVATPEPSSFATFGLLVLCLCRRQK